MSAQLRFTSDRQSLYSVPFTDSPLAVLVSMWGGRFRQSIILILIGLRNRTITLFATVRRVLATGGGWNGRYVFFTKIHLI